MGLIDSINSISQLDGLSLEIGIQGTDIASGDEEPDTLIEIAARLEYGSDGGFIVSRPWMRTTFDKYAKTKWLNGFKKILKFASKNDFEKVRQGLRLLGQEAKDNMQDMLRDGDWVPNSPKTIAAKGSSKPLIDTSQLLNSHRALVAWKGKREVVA